MRKIIIVGVLALGILGTAIPISAEEEHTKSTGNLEGKGVQLYSEDIRYLEKEIKILLKECRKE